MIPSGEPVPGRYGLAEQHFKRCGLKGLPHGDLPGIALNDDGVDGDLQANDGIYSVRFTGTDTEGSYTMRFFVRGKTEDGVSYSRMRTLSQYVGIEPSAADTESQLHAGPTLNGLPTTWVSFLPRDDQGNYVGPGYAHKFDFSVNGGQLVDDTIDLNNGYYLQMVQYPEAGPEPEVTIRTERCCFQQRVGESDPDKPDPAEPVFDELHKWLLLVIIILLILLLVCWVRRRARALH